MVVCLFSDVFRKNIFYILLLLAAGFWYFFYPHHVLYQESYNLFLYTSAFFQRYALKPGGWSEYAGLFMMQFFRYLWVGIFLNVLALLWVQNSVSRLFGQWGIFRQWYVWAWLPALGLLGLQMNYDFLFSETLKVVLFFFLLAFLGGIKNKKLNMFLPWIMAPLLLLLLGGGLYIMFYLLWFVGRMRTSKSGYNSGISLGGLILAALVWWLWRMVYLIPYPQLYEFFPDASRIWVISGARLLFYGFAGILLVGHFLPHLKAECLKGRLFMVVVSAGILAGCILGLRKYNYHPGVESLLHAELAVSNENWKEMLKLAETNRYDIPTFVALTNLALAKEGRLAERMFNYPQVGKGGLILPAGANYLVNLYGHEIYFQLGQNNEAYRYLFEAYNCKAGQVSGHVLKRMAELLLRLERPEAARKILYQLKNSLFYQAWAEEELQKLAHFVPAGPSKGEDFYPGFSDLGVDLMNMVRQDPGNKMLQEYLLTTCLLEKQIPVFYHFFVEFYPAGQTIRLPKMYEEALLIVFQTGLDKTVLEKYKVSEEQFRRIKNYTYAYKKLMRNPAAASLMYDDFGNTYWYYMHFKKVNT